jgi:plasmid maintenance system killer protein
MAVRLRPSARFIKSRQRLSSLNDSINRALDRFRKNPDHPGLNFEPVKNTKNSFTIRVNRNFRILLLAEQDEAGPYFLVADVMPHDDAYRRR